MTALLVLASTRTQIGDFVQALVTVYGLIIVAYIVLTWVLNFGGRIAYSRWFDMVFTFLRDTTEPYLGLFRRFIPPFGPLDLSPIVALFVLYIGGGLIANAIHG
jgi:uncharacterized protein YggT (Ycf19 family)